MADKFMPEALENIRQHILAACHDALIALLKAYVIRRYCIKGDDPKYDSDYENLDISMLYSISNELLRARDDLARNHKKGRNNQDLDLGDSLYSINPIQMVDYAKKYVKLSDAFLSFWPSQLDAYIKAIINPRVIHSDSRGIHLNVIIYERFICTILLLQYTCQIVAGKCIQEGLSDLEEEFKRIHKFYNYLRYPEDEK